MENKTQLPHQPGLSGLFLSRLDDRVKVGFTGTQQGMTDRQKYCIKKLLRKASELHFGDCTGADEEAFEIARALKIKTVCWPPKNPYARAFCKADVIQTPDEYLARNKKIVNNSESLLATPKEFAEVIRSGTWATLRYARKISRPYLIVFPDGILSDKF